MTRWIWKFAVERPRQVIELPLGARVLHTAWQGFSPMIWVLVEPDGPKERRTFAAIATGEPFDTEGATYIGTCHSPTALVWHIWEGPVPGASQP